MNKRKVLGTVCSWLKLLPVLKVFDAKRDSLKILAYHRVKDIDTKRYLFDRDLIDATEGDFFSQMEFLADNYTVMTLSDAMLAFNAGKEKNIVVVTIDDGFDDVYNNIFPVLKEFNIPATVFLTTGLVGSDDTLWSEKIVYALNLNNSKAKDLRLDSGDKSITVDLSDVDASVSVILRELKRVSNEQRETLMSEIFQQLGVNGDISHPDSRMLDWKQIKIMTEYGIEFGSHTVSHPVLAKLSPSELLAELSDSRQTIQQELGLSCDTIAYPVGGVGSFDEKVIAQTKQLGYQVGCSYLSGINYRGTKNLFALKRIHIDHTVNLGWFMAQLALPSLFAANFSKD